MKASDTHKEQISGYCARRKPAFRLQMSDASITLRAVIIIAGDVSEAQRLREL